jgi:hypothetical protein
MLRSQSLDVSGLAVVRNFWKVRLGSWCTGVALFRFHYHAIYRSKDRGGSKFLGRRTQ